MIVHIPVRGCTVRAWCLIVELVCVLRAACLQLPSEGVGRVQETAGVCLETAAVCLQETPAAAQERQRGGAVVLQGTCSPLLAGCSAGGLHQQ